MKITPDIKRLIQNAIEEDRVHHDITTKTLIDKKQISSAYILTRQDAIGCGFEIVKTIFKTVDPRVKIAAYYKDGSALKKNEPVVFLHGATRSLLSAERVALNFLGHLSGIATLTQQFVQAIKPYKTKILDTRKTTPGLRALEKYAVKCGGGENHRRDLSDMILIKDNHLLSKTYSLAETVAIVRKKTKKEIEVEVDTLEQFKEILPQNPDMILLDNMSLGEMKQAVALKRKNRAKTLLEASGGVNLKTVKNIAATGVDRISVGQLTHSAPVVDFSLEFVV